MDQTFHANSGALGASGHNGICLDGPHDRLQASALANGYFRAQRHLIIVFVLPLTGGGTLEDQHAHCLSVNRGDVLDASAAAPPQLCGTGMAQVSVRGVGGRGSERLRAEASRLRRPTRGRVVLRAASSFLPAFSQSSAPILFGLSLQVCQASRRGGDVRQSGLGPGIEPSE
jgi:hypothetical protein